MVSSPCSKIALRLEAEPWLDQFQRVMAYHLITWLPAAQHPRHMVQKRPPKEAGWPWHPQETAYLWQMPVMKQEWLIMVDQSGIKSCLSFKQYCVFHHVAPMVITFFMPRTTSLFVSELQSTERLTKSLQAALAKSINVSKYSVENRWVLSASAPGNPAHCET